MVSSVVFQHLHDACDSAIIRCCLWIEAELAIRCRALLDVQIIELVRSSMRGCWEATFRAGNTFGCELAIAITQFRNPFADPEVASLAKPLSCRLMEEVYS